jgi:hypothetical protein
MQKAYIGESFELVFDISDPKDPERIVDSASYRVIAPDGSISQAGIMSIDDGAHTCRFRFNADVEGISTIEISWSMGLDRYKQPHLISVEALRG